MFWWDIGLGETANCVCFSKDDFVNGRHLRSLFFPFDGEDEISVGSSCSSLYAPIFLLDDFLSLTFSHRKMLTMCH